MKSSLCALLLVAASAGNGRVERQLEHPWGRWQPGAWVELRTSSPALPEGLLERSQLVRFGNGGYDLTSTVGTDGVPRELHHGWGFGGYAHVMPDARLVGRETVRVGTREHDCEVWEGSWQEGEETFVSRAWIAPGFDLPLRARMASPSGGLELVLVEPDDFVRIGERKLKAARYQGNGRSQSASLEFRQWLTLDVPGGVARMETIVKDKGETTNVLREVTVFRCTPLSAR